MGKCTVSSALLEEFSWAKAENQDQVRCKLDNRVFRISHGRFDLKQHEETQLHKKAVTARAATPNIRTATYSQTDCQRLRALIIYVLDIVVNGQPFASSDSASSARGKYKQIFPDSGHANITCGMTKATYVAVHGIAPYARTIWKVNWKTSLSVFISTKHLIMVKQGLNSGLFNMRTVFDTDSLCLQIPNRFLIASSCHRRIYLMQLLLLSDFSTFHFTKCYTQWLLTVVRWLVRTRVFMSLDINPKKYAIDLYKKNSGGVVVPMVFSPVNKKLFCSNVPIVQSALCSLEKHLEQSDWLIFSA